MDQLISVVGWIGVVVYVSAYGLLSAGVLKPDRSNYHMLNAIGALSLVVYSWSLLDMPNVIVNAVWLGIALVSIANIIFGRYRKTRDKP